MWKYSSLLQYTARLYVFWEDMSDAVPDDADWVIARALSWWREWLRRRAVAVDSWAIHVEVILHLHRRYTHTHTDTQRRRSIRCIAMVNQQQRFLQWSQSIFGGRGGAKFYRVDSRIQIKRYSRPSIFYWGGAIAPLAPTPGSTPLGF